MKRSPGMFKRHRPGRRLIVSTLLAIGMMLNFILIPFASAAGADNLGSATPITPPLTHDMTDTTGATRDAGEIGGGPAGNPCNFTLAGNTHSVWYSYTAASNGWLQLVTFGSSYDTVLEVFAGPASPTFATLTSLACNDDSAGTRQSALTAPVMNGASYYIVVRSYGGGPGGNLDFSAAFSSQLNIYVNQTTGSDNNPGTAALPVKTIQRAVNLAPPSATSNINIVSPGSYDEAVTIGKALTFVVPSGVVTANAFTLTSGADVALSGAGTISAPTVNVQPGASIQQSISLVSVGGVVDLAPGTYAQNVTIDKDLTLQGASAPPSVIDPSSGDAITINNGTATITNLTIQGAVTGINVTGGAGHTIYRNNITTNTNGVINGTGAPVNAAENFWGNATGPTHATNAGGTGDSVSNNVDYRPWCTTPVPTCLPRAGASTRLVFTTSPGNTPAGVSFAAQPVVRAEDDLGNLDTAFNGPVTLAIKGGTGTAGAALGGAITLNASNGVADFAGQGVNINYIGQGYQLTATSGPLNSSSTGDSAPFDITADRLAFSTSPGNTPAGVAFAAQPVVEARDAFGHLDTNFNGAVTLAIKGGTGTPGAALNGTVTVAASNGVATFSGLSIDLIGSGYQLTASDGTLPVAESTPFNITAGTPTQLVFAPSPSDSTGGVAFPTQPVVEVRDAGGNLVTSYTGSITVTIGANPGAGTLAGTTVVQVSNGKASFSGLSIDKPGAGYTLQASTGDPLTATSAPFNITVGPIAKFVFNPSPSDSTAGTVFPTQPVVEAQDAGGNLVTTITGTVTLAIGSNPGGGTLSGTTTAMLSGGKASFSGLSIDKAGNGYTLQAGNGSATGASAPFNITAGAPTQLVFTSSPADTRVGVAFTNQPVVVALDAYGNTATGFTGPVTATITTGTGTVGATLGGTTTVNAVSGVASFSGLSIDKIGAGYRLTASAAGPLSVDSSSFNITATGLVFTLQPVTTSAGQPILVRVAAQDASNNTDTTFSGAVTLAIKFGTGAPRATLGGTVTVNAVNGVADFTGQGLNITDAAAGYILIASTPGLAGAESQSFDITGGPASELVFATSPGNTPAGAPLAFVVEARDSFGNLATGFSGMLDLSIANNPGGGTLGGRMSKAFSGGIASFGAADGVNINRIGVGYTLHAASGSLTAADSAAFNITASRLVFAAAPGNTPVGSPFAAQPVLRAEDGFGTLDTTFTGPVTLAIAPGTGTSGASLNGTVTLAASGGIASFTRLSIDRVGAGYQLSAAAAGVPSATSPAFDITRSVLYAPLMLTPGYPDLVATFKLNTSTVVADKPVVVTVTITNQGNVPASQFWVDFYVNPTTPPTGANQPWDKSCGGRRCEQGIAWYVDRMLAPGESITLTSTPGSYYAKNTAWNGSFKTGLLHLYVYADSWNPGMATGAVYESNESNNRAEFHTTLARATAPAETEAAPTTELPALPPRPVRPE